MTTVKIERPSYNDEKLREAFALPKSEEDKSLKSRITEKWEKYSFIEQLKTWFPVAKWIPQYNLKKQLLGDILAGITIGVVNIPQGMAFAALTYLPPVFGLYIAFFPVIIYALMSSCHHQSWGGFGVTAIMSGEAVTRILDQRSGTNPGESSDIMTTLSYMNTTAGSPISDSLDLDTVIEVSITIALLVGLIQSLMGFLNLGFVSVYLSKSFIQALTTGAACHVITSQVPTALGIVVTRHSGPFGIVKIWIDIFANLPSINWATLVVSLISLALLIIMTIMNERWKDKLIVPIPMDMIVVVIITLSSFLIDLNEKYDVSIVDDIPLGFPPPRVPSPSLFLTLLGDSFAIAIVTYAVNISLGKTVADKHNYKIDDNQELLASGISNAFGSFFLCYVSGPSLARIWIVEKAGGTSQLVSAVNCILVLFMMLFLGTLLEPLPLAVLSVLLIYSLKEMLFQVRVLPSLYRQSKWDFTVWVFTCCCVIFLGVAFGLFISVGFAILLLAVRIQLPSYKNEGNIEESELFVDEKIFKVENHSKCVVFHMESSLCFLNAKNFMRRVMALPQLQGLDTEEEQTLHTKTEQTEEEHSLMGPKADSPDDKTEVSMSVSKTDSTGDKTEVSVQLNGESVLPLEEINVKSKELEMVLIINCSSFAFVDHDGARILATVIKDYQTRKVTVLLASCSESVRCMLLGSGQFDKLDNVFYPSVLDAFHSFLENPDEDC